MKNRYLIIIAALFLILPNLLCAASIKNTDGKPHKLKARSEGRGGWIRTTIYPSGTKYFDCIYGCEIKVLGTGSTILLDSDADIAISGGILRTR
jgi:hypothetical protein